MVEIWSVEHAIKKQVTIESNAEWSKSPNLVSPPVTLKPIVRDNPAWYVLINNMVIESKRLVNELAP